MTQDRPKPSASRAPVSSVDVAKQRPAANQRSRAGSDEPQSQTGGPSRKTRGGKPPARKAPVRQHRKEASPGQQTWKRRAWDRLWKFAATGYAISLLLHTSLLLMLAIVFFPNKSGQESISTVLSQSDKDATEFDDVIDTTEPLAAMELEAVELPQFESVPTTNETMEPTIPDDLMSRFAPSAAGSAGTGGGASGGLGLPKGANAVTKGSFTVWTIPEDPKPRQTYIIVIQIELPEHLRRYPTRDLSGRVIGTDGYTQSIPGRTRGYLPIKEHHTQLQIRVPGGEKLVEDTIQVESRILKEKQTLVIVF